MKKAPERKMSRYAVDECAARLDRLAYEVSRAGKLPGIEPVHDVRVAIRRFLSCLRAFRTFFPKKEVKRVRRRLKAVMSQAGDVRDRDIAIQLAAQAGVNLENGLVTRWRAEREEAAAELARLLQQLTHDDFSLKWRSRLGL